MGKGKGKKKRQRQDFRRPMPVEFSPPPELIIQALYEEANRDPHLAEKLEKATWKASAIMEREQKEQLEARIQELEDEYLPDKEEIKEGPQEPEDEQLEDGEPDDSDIDTDDEAVV